jgi:phosphoglycolate phosphatase-like HAD superfamily hydrolase
MTAVDGTGKRAQEIVGRTKTVLFDFDMTLIDSSAGIPCFAVATGPSGREVLVSAGADRVFDSCLEIETLFRIGKAERACVWNE